MLSELSGSAVLTSQWCSGQRFDAFRSTATPAARDRAGEALFRFHVGSLYQHSLFHADPHPGNYAFDAQGRVTIYDFGCVREYPRPIVVSLARCAAAMRHDDLDGALAALAAVGATPPGSDYERDALHALLKGFFAPLLTARTKAF